MAGGAEAAPLDRRPLPPWALAGVGVGGYLFCGTQSVNDWSPNRNVAQFPRRIAVGTACSTEGLDGGDAVGRAVDLDGRPLDPVGRDVSMQGDLVPAEV